jgi:hypothetical protein
MRKTLVTIGIVAHILMVPALGASVFVPSLVFVFFGIFAVFLIAVVVIFEWGSYHLVAEVGDVLKEAVARQREKGGSKKRAAGVSGDGLLSVDGSTNASTLSPRLAGGNQSSGDAGTTSLSEGSRDDATPAAAPQSRKEARRAKRERTAAEEAHARLWRFTRFGHLTTLVVALTLTSFALAAVVFPASAPDTFLIGQSIFRVLELAFVSLIMMNLHPSISGAMGFSYMMDLIFRPKRIRQDVRVAQRKAKLRAAAGRGVSSEHNLRDSVAVDGNHTVRYKTEAQSYVESFVFDIDSAIMDKGMGDFVDPIFVGDLEQQQSPPRAETAQLTTSPPRETPSALNSPSVIMSTGGTPSADASSESSGRKKKLSRGSSGKSSRGSSVKKLSRGSSRKTRPSKPADPGDDRQGSPAPEIIPPTIP